MIKNNLSKIMGELRINQQDLAEDSQLGTATIQRLYNNKTSGIEFDTLNKLCKSLNKIIENKNKDFPFYKKITIGDIFSFIDEDELYIDEKKTLVSLNN